MKKHLYFICPTDYLETVINGTFKQENYYITSLGNSITFDRKTVAAISKLVEKKNITEITFVLSDNNPIVMDGLNDQDFANVWGLGHFYRKITKLEVRAELLWQTGHLAVPVLAYYLGKRIEDLRAKLGRGRIDRLAINAKVFYSQRNVFREPRYDLFYRESFKLN